MTGAFETALSGAATTPAAETSPVSTPAETSTPAESPAPAAITQAATETPAPESVAADAEAPVTGEPPKWRWQDILANARKTAAEEAEARLKQEYETKVRAFEGVDPSELAGYRVMQAALAGNPQAIAQVRQNPEALQALRAMVAEQQATADPEPEPDLQTADGTPVFSAQAKREHDAWLRRELKREWQQEIAPLKQDAETRQQETATHQYATTLQGVVAEMKAADPAFEKHLPDVRAVINGDPELLRYAIGDEQTKANPRLALRYAWNEVYRTKVAPAQRQAAEAETVANLQQRAVAGTVNPSSPTAGSPKKFSKGEKGFAEALAHFGQTKAS